MGKVREWWDRYALPEFSSGFFSILFACLVWYSTENLIIAAFAGSLGDNISYYAIIVYRDLKKRQKKAGRIRKRDYIIEMRNLLIEFGPAEYLDTFIVRPFFLVIVPMFIPIYPVAVIVGGLIADFFFYIPTIFGYEARKKYLKD